MEELVRLTETGIFQKKRYRDQEEYFKDTARMLLERGVVSSEFETVIMRREAQYPTGIVTGTIPVSIPNADRRNRLRNTNPLFPDGRAGKRDRGRIVIHASVKGCKQPSKYAETVDGSPSVTTSS